MKKNYTSLLLMAIFLLLYPQISFAERCAIFFFEYEHKDSNEPSIEEKNAETVSRQNLSSSYSEMIFLVNTEATRGAARGLSALGAHA